MDSLPTVFGPPLKRLARRMITYGVIVGKRATGTTLDLYGIYSRLGPISNGDRVTISASYTVTSAQKSTGP